MVACAETCADAVQALRSSADTRVTVFLFLSTMPETAGSSKEKTRMSQALDFTLSPVMQMFLLSPLALVNLNMFSLVRSRRVSAGSMVQFGCKAACTLTLVM